MMLKHNTGAATLLIHILANIATPMLVSKTVRGLVPALLRTKVAIILAILYFDSAAAMVNPPRRSMITGVHMDAKTALVASFGPSRLCGLSSDRMIPRTTTRKGINNEVTKSGMAY